jgi:holo-[acyl-carrier protein] synthase
VIIGIGSDIIRIPRIGALLISYKQRFLHRIFTIGELDLLPQNNKLAAYVAKRFAAKEAFSKAIGTGIGKDVSFQDLEIFSEKSGKPYFKLSDKLNKFLLKNYTQLHTHLSMTDEEEYAQAFVVIEGMNK